MKENRDLLTPLWRRAEPPELTPRQWELLLAQARVARLGARLALRYEHPTWRRTVPAVVLPHLSSAQRYAGLLQREVQFEARKISGALEKAALRAVFLKGAAYVLGGLPPAQGRLFSDIDILVPAGQLRNAESALQAAGWIAEKLTPYDDRYYRQFMHELPPLRHVERQTHLDVHHTISPPSSRHAIDGSLLLQAARPASPEPGAAWVLAPCDMVLHSALHLMQEGEFSTGLRDLLDLQDLLQHFSNEPDFVRSLLHRAEFLGLTRPLTHVLLLLEFVLGRPALDGAEVRAFMARAAASPTVRFTSHLLRQALQPMHPSCDGAGVRFARWALYVRGHWLRMPWYQIVPHLLRKTLARAAERLRSHVPDGKNTLA